MEYCINCGWFKKIYGDNGYCKMWDVYRKDNSKCNDFEERGV